jgi:uncharacterized protein (TIGR02611 family)
MSRRQRRGLRGKVAANPATDLIWRIVVGVIGGAVTFVGVVFLITPGPGWLVIFVGLGILASEFAWAERALFKAKMAALKAKRQALDPKRRQRLYIVSAVALAGTGALIWLWLR